jgi:hypothetical protein
VKRLCGLEVFEDGQMCFSDMVWSECGRTGCSGHADQAGPVVLDQLAHGCAEYVVLREYGDAVNAISVLMTRTWYTIAAQEQTERRRDMRAIVRWAAVAVDRVKLAR